MAAIKAIAIIDDVVALPLDDCVVASVASCMEASFPFPEGDLLGLRLSRDGRTSSTARTDLPASRRPGARLRALD
ncbi:hypothetical protein ACFW47_17590 [Streptomyces sp. NPDC058796]|uniref:hypothetical protein n=1 Tax=Streptomyces sp. NPDC058796 TaxID=3346637 RepID=UPI00368496C8